MKKVKNNAILFKLFWYKVFVHRKLKLLNFLMDSILIIKMSRAITTTTDNNCRAISTINHWQVLLTVI